MNTVLYLAAPYSHQDPAIRRKRFERVCTATAQLFQQGYLVYSPLTHNVTLEDFGLVDGSWAHWQRFDLAMLSRCDKLLVLQLEGWEKSTGVKAEIEHAQQMKRPVEYISFVEEELVLED